MLISSAQRAMITAAARNWVVRMSTLVSQYRGDHDLTWFTPAQVRRIVETLDVVIFPQVNPDGRHFSIRSPGRNR